MTKVKKANSGHLSKYLGLLKNDKRSADEMISEIKKNRIKATKEMKKRQTRFRKL